MTDRQEDLERYLALEMAGEERDALESEVLAKDELSDRLYADMSMLVALETATQARQKRLAKSAKSAPWWQWQPLRWAIPVAAMATIIAFLIGRGPSAPEAPPVFRGGYTALEVLTPKGDVTAPPHTFVWRRDVGSAFVRFELFDAASTSLYSVTAETSLVVKVSTIDIPSRGYWVLTPLDDLRVPIGEEVTTWYQVRR